MAQPVTIESDGLRATVWPQFGGKVSSVVDKADGYELLFTYPAELPAGPQYDLPYGKGWYAGWDECFPGVAPGKYVGHPYDGVAVPDPYRWLEDWSDPAVKKWSEAQSAHARAYLDRLPGTDAIRNQLKSILADFVKTFA